VKLSVVPIELSDANQAIAAWHRHHQPCVGHRFSLGVVDESGVLHGAAVIGSQLHCYEPVLSNYDLLLENTKAFVDRVDCYNVGVGEPGLRDIYYGKHNRGECSLYKGAEQRDAGEQVLIIDPQKLPDAHLVKIDTEGAEIEILEGMTYLPFAYVIEYHSDANRRTIDRLLHDYTLMEMQSTSPNYGIVKYVRTDLL